MLNFVFGGHFVFICSDSVQTSMQNLDSVALKMSELSGTLNAVDFNGGGHFVSGLCSPETKWPPPLKSTAFKVPI